MDIVRSLDELCSELPNNAVHGQSSPLKRSAASVPRSRVEGDNRKNTKDVVQFLKIASGSRLELETQFILTQELNMIPKNEHHTVLRNIEEEHKMLNAFIRSMERTKQALVH